MKWEYKVINVNVHFNTGNGAESKLQKVCEDCGEEGWELVSCQNYDMASKFMLVFKRPKNN